MSAGEKPRKGRRDRERARAARFLADGSACRHPSAKKDRVLLETHDRGTISLDAAVLQEMQRSGLVGEADGKIHLTSEGAAYAKRLARPLDPYRSQHWCLETQVVAVSGKARQTATVNIAESPLVPLARRRDRNGVPFLSQAEFEAGERLRADYTRGQIMPRLGANWTAAVAQSKRTAGPAGAAELAESALAARQRVEKALEAVGPELAGVLVDICCFLKGLERVEMERGWPVRSAKVVLKTALGVLSRHYEPPPERRARRRILHWGASGYRPRLRS